MITFKQFITEAKPKTDVVLKKIKQLAHQMQWDVHNVRKTGNGTYYVSLVSLNTSEQSVIIRISDHKNIAKGSIKTFITIIASGKAIDYDKVRTAILKGDRTRTYTFGGE